MVKLPTRKPSKVRPVPIAQMRVPTALVVQREFRQAHADKIAANMDPNKLGFPVVNHRDGYYWILDGQHRIAALKQWDPAIEQTNLDCEVYEDLTDSEMAEIFLGRDARKQIPPFDKFHVACTAGRQRENDIRRAIETNGQKLSRDHNEGISTVGALGKVYDLCGDIVLGQVIRTINLGFGSDPLKVTGQSIGDGDSDDFGKFVGMARPDGGLELRVEWRARLDGERCFLGGFDFPAPVIE
jgi:hypothetical protein